MLDRLRQLTAGLSWPQWLAVIAFALIVSMILAPAVARLFHNHNARKGA